MASMREPGALDDDGKVDGYPVEGLCLAVLDDGRARPAWLCRKEDNRQGRLKVLIYGDASGKARTLLSSERVDALPSTDEALAARLQGDWKNASTQERDELLRGCDEMEARRAAPPQFLDMVQRLRATARGDAKALAPSSSCGREFYPNLFPPRIGDAVRVLWDQHQWYEAAAVDAPALDGAVAPASAYSTPPSSACWAAFGWAPPPRGAAPPRLHVRYAIDGTRDALVWPDPDHEAFLLAPPRSQQTNPLEAPRRRAQTRDRCPPPARDWRSLLTTMRGASGDGFEKEPSRASESIAPLDAYTALLAEWSKPRNSTPVPRATSASLARGTTQAPQETRAWREVLKGRRDAQAASDACRAAQVNQDIDNAPALLRLKAVDDALKGVAAPLAALLDDFSEDDGSDPQRTTPLEKDWPWAWDKRDAPIGALHALSDALAPLCRAASKRGVSVASFRREARRAELAIQCVGQQHTDGIIPSESHDQKQANAAMKRAADLIRVCWDAKSAEETLGPTNDALARGSDCWALLPSTRVPEPHASWLRRAREAAREVLEDQSPKKRKRSRSKSPSPEKGPRPYRPPGAAARALLGGDQGVMLLRTVPAPIVKCLAEGLGKGSLAQQARVVSLSGEESNRAHPLLKGEKGVVAHRNIEAGCAAPYAGVIATDYEIAVLLRRAPRAAARWLMYRYEFAHTGLSVLPYLGVQNVSPAPFINCARGPDAREALVAKSAREARIAPQTPRAKKPRGPVKGTPGGRKWRAWGSRHVGLRVRRTVFAEDSSAMGTADGTVVSWVDEAESDFRNGSGDLAPLWRVVYDAGGLLGGDSEDLEQHELLASARAPQLVESSGGRGSNVEDEKAPLKANCHFREVTADDAKPSTNKPPSVLGAFIVATKPIQAGEPLLVSYGREFWSGWAQRKARLGDLESAADHLVDAAAKCAKHFSSDSRALSTEHVKDERDPDPLHPPPSGELWRFVIGVPFESCRTSRGSMRWRGVVVGLATDAPAAHASTGGAPSSVTVGERVEGYWCGRSPAWPATVAKSATRGRPTCLAYDDGGREDGVALDLIRQRRSPEAWKDAVKPGHVPVGAWVRRCGNNAPQKTKPDATREEGVVIHCHADGAFDVRLDDGALLENRTTDLWEPLLVLRYEEGHDQRVVSMDQLRFLRPRFLDAATLRSPPEDEVSSPSTNLKKVLLEAGLRDPRRA